MWLLDIRDDVVENDFNTYRVSGVLQRSPYFRPTIVVSNLFPFSERGTSTIKFPSDLLEVSGVFTVCVCVRVRVSLPNKTFDDIEF